MYFIETENKIQYMEDVSSFSLELMDSLEKRMQFLLGPSFKLTREQDDRIYDAIRDTLEEHCETGDYKHHM